MSGRPGACRVRCQTFVSTPFSCRVPGDVAGDCASVSQHGLPRGSPGAYLTCKCQMCPGLFGFAAIRERFRRPKPDSTPSAPHFNTLRVKSEKKPEDLGAFRLHRWSRQQESNLHLPLRRGPFYPLNYGEHRLRSLAVPVCTGCVQTALPCRSGSMDFGCCRTQS